MRNSPLLITGANGFIGSNLCRHFLARGYRVYGFVRPTSDLHFLEGLNVQIITGDLGDVSRIPVPEGISAVIHSAALVSDYATDSECDRHILQATAHLVRKLRDEGAPLRRFIYMSTAIVLGFDGLGISEERPGRSAEFVPYVRFKKKTEQFLLAEHAERELPLVILRPGDVYGPYDRTSCGRLLQACERGMPLIAGHGRWRFGYCYIGNLCQAAELALETGGIEGRAYTITNGLLPTWREFFGALQRGLGEKQRLYIPVRGAIALAGLMSGLRKIFPGYEPALNYYRIKRITTETTYDISRAVAELGYRPDDDFEAQAGKIVAWYRAERESGHLF